MKILSLGSGFENIEGDITTVDIAESTNPDIVWDLNKTPLPLEDESFDKIVMYDVIEHLNDVIPAIEECYRLLKPEGLLHLKTPHFSSPNSFTDPTHKFHLGYNSFDFFVPDHERFYYSKAKFSIESRYLYFNRHRYWNKFFESYANKNPWYYEQRLAWIFPACYLDFLLKKV
jgi:SAM-dependent methyltransferase